MEKKTLYIGVGIAAALLLFTKKSGAKGFSNPVEGSHKISSGFGMRVHPVTGVQKFHNGVDIPVPLNTKILAPADGVVEKVYWTDLAGNQIVIKHNNGYKTGYAHLTSSAVAVGDKVKKGKVIAYSGNTGTSTTGAHLHFTLTNPAGEKIDPQSIFTF